MGIRMNSNFVSELLPDGFDDWFARCLRKDAGERYESAGEAVADAGDHVAGADKGAPLRPDVGNQAGGLRLQGDVARRLGPPEQDELGEIWLRGNSTDTDAGRRLVGGIDGGGPFRRAGRLRGRFGTAELAGQNP